LRLGQSFVETAVSADRTVVVASDSEKSLIANLFEEREYNSLIRPVKSRSETIDVGFEMALIQIITLVSTRTA